MANKQRPQDSESAEFKRFKELTRNLVSVSNAEVREKMEEEKRHKKTKGKRKES
jgi:hypothetical protein